MFFIMVVFFIFTTVQYKKRFGGFRCKLMKLLQALWDEKFSQIQWREIVENLSHRAKKLYTVLFNRTVY